MARYQGDSAPQGKTVASAPSPHPSPQTIPPGIGHNGGPDLYQGYKTWLWRNAQKKAWKAPPREVMLRRLKRAQELGMTYREYTLEILERGRYL